VSIEIEKSLLFSSIPEGLRNKLFRSFNEIHRNFREQRWEPSELNGGKLCEVVYTILRGYVDRNFSSSLLKPRNMIDACRSLSQTSSSFSRSIRIQIPHMLISLYEIRNNRGVGHIGGDVDPNHMDAVAVLYMSKWIIAELIRIFHDIDTHTASILVDMIVDRTLPVVWQVGNKLRILKTNLSMKEKTLVLLYHKYKQVLESDLVLWLEHSNPSVYRRDILRKLHRNKLIEYDKSNRTAIISPSGVCYVEQNIKLDF
jgi:hypothetical protein